MVTKLLKKYGQFIVFALVGCCNTLVDFLVFTLLNAVLGCLPYVSQIGGYSAGILCSFLLNRKFTFGVNGGFWLQVILFILMNLLSMGVSAGLITLLVAWGINTYFAKIAVTGVVMVMNFFGYKYVVFRNGRTKHD